MNNYNFFQQLLHRIALSSRFMRETTFEIEKSIFLKKSKVEIERPVFVTGLARSGTTILLEAIHASDDFASLSYSDMPLLMAPNIWKSICRKGENLQKIERAHGDGIMVNSNSPEAFEEVFWQTFGQQDIESQFKDYIRLILCSYKKRRYLSKNNQNVNRIDILQKILPNAKVLIVFKEPIHHAASLLKQHVAFSKVQQEDSFIKDYMDWTKHSEFGLSYHPITPESLRHNDQDGIDHWLEQWYLLYGRLMKYHENDYNVVFVNGGLLHTERSWQKISNFLEIKCSSFKFRDTSSDIRVDCDQKLLQNCRTLYNKLNSICL